VESWQQSLDRVVQLDPAHISCYALTIEEETKLAHNIARQVTVAPDDARQVEMDEAADLLLRRAGFQRYEISNYAKPGYLCRQIFCIGPMEPILASVRVPNRMSMEAASETSLM